MVTKRWIERTGDPAAERTLQQDLNLSPLNARVLSRRGYQLPETAAQFFHDRLSALPDPDLLPDMEKAVTRLVTALQQGEKISIHGDYDVDGITGTSLLLDALGSLGADIEYRIPSRLADGYGLSGDALRLSAAAGCQVVVSVDCGVTAVDEAALASQLGLDLIVTDHHQPPPDLPRCLALVNPHLAENRFPWPNLAGVGVAFFLCLALRRRLREEGWFTARPEPDFRQLLDLVALGTIADMVPLGGVNRLLVRYGLDLLDRGGRLGVAVLKRVAGVQRVTCGSVGFRLAPRLNAAGRLEDAAQGVELLLATDLSEAEVLASHLDECNRQRQQLEAQTLEEAVALVESGAGCKHSLVLGAEDWRAGVIGIVASRLVERYYRPTIMIALEDGRGKGSARSVYGFNLYEALCETRHSLSGFGGHAAAAGVSIVASDIPRFRQDFEAFAASRLQCEDLVPRLEHDGEVRLDELSMAAVRELGQLAPFGIGNPQPAFTSFAVQSLSPQIVGEKHLKFRIAAGETEMDCIAFGQAERYADLGAKVDLLFRPEINSFRGRESVQLQILDFRVSQ